LNPSDDDLKQMFAYNMYLGAKKSILLYPWVGQNEKGYGDFVIDQDSGNQCKLGFVSVLDQNGILNRELGSSVFERIKNK